MKVEDSTNMSDSTGEYLPRYVLQKSPPPQEIIEFLIQEG